MAKFTDKIKNQSGKSKKWLYIVGGVIVFVVIYLYLSSGNTTSSDNRSDLAPVPGGIQNQQGGKYSAEYTRALQQNNQLLAQEAQMQGESSVATMINTGDVKGPTCQHTCCSCQKPKLKDTINAWVKSGKISQATADALDALSKKNLSVGDYAKQLDRLVREGKLTPEQARQLLAAYQREHGDALAAQTAKDFDADIQSGKLPVDAANDLLNLERNGASTGDYAEALARLVKEGKISPEMAKKLLAAYEKKHGQLSKLDMNGLVDTGLSADFTPVKTKAQPNLADQSVQQTSLPGFSNTLEHPQLQDSQVANNDSAEEAALAQARQQQIAALSTSMKTQAGNIIKGISVSTQQAVVATPPKPKPGAEDAEAGSDQSGASTGSDKDNAKGPVVKAGDIEFAVLDTAVDSDYPGSPVMATIVQGKLKGGKLLGKLTTGKNGNDRVILTFTMLNMPNWAEPQSINAVAIDPKTARSAIATSVNYHILSRYGALFASAFLEGYADTFTQAGTIIVDNGTTVQTNPPLSPKQRIFAGIGKFGSATSSAAENYFNTPPTVKVKSGVGLGILFMENVTKPKNAGAQPESISTKK